MTLCPVIPYTLKWAERYTPKMTFSWWETGPHVMHGFLGPTRDHIPNGISIASSVLGLLVVATNTHTHTHTHTFYMLQR